MTIFAKNLTTNDKSSKKLIIMSSNLHLYLLSLGIAAAMATDASAFAPKQRGVDLPAPIA